MLLDAIRIVGRAFGVDLKRYSPLRRAIDILAAGPTRPYFVQIGANNGTDFDNFYEAVTEHRLPGIVVEPVADYHAALTQAYARFPEVTPLRAAIHPTLSSTTMYRVAQDRARFLWQHGIASFDRAHLLRHDVPEDAIVTEEVPCLSMTDLLKRVPQGRIVDILVTDTEGFDAEILRMIDFATLRPRVLRFEEKHMSAADRDGVRRLLGEQDYVLHAAAGDVIAIDRSLACGPLTYLRRVRRR